MRLLFAVERCVKELLGRSNCIYRFACHASPLFSLKRTTVLCTWTLRCVQCWWTAWMIRCSLMISFSFVNLHDVFILLQDNSYDSYSQNINQKSGGKNTLRKSYKLICVSLSGKKPQAKHDSVFGVFGAVVPTACRSLTRFSRVVLGWSTMFLMIICNRLIDMIVVSLW